jgi:hypothetical protein
MRLDDSDHSSSLLLAAGSLTLAAALVAAHAPGLALLLLAVFAVAALLAVDGARTGSMTLPGRARTWVVGSGAALSGLTMVVRFEVGNLGLRVACAAAVVLLAVIASKPPAGVPASLAMAALALVQGGVLLSLVLTRDARIDVVTFLTDGSRAVLHGADPYTAHYPNIYPPSQAALLYGPGIVGPGGMLTVGLPYPPASLVVAVPAFLLGDVRVGALVLLLGMAVLLHRTGSPAGRAPAVMLACAPGLLELVFFGWTEGVILGLFMAAAWLGARGRWLAAAAVLGLALASKQYFVVTVPCLWLLRELVGRARVAVLVGTAAAVTLPFVVWNFAGFWRSVVQFQLLQPFRTDSVSLLVWSVNTFHWPGPAVYGALPLVVGLLVGVATARWMRPGVPGFLTATSLSLLATTVLSKQAFLNYYFLIGGLLVLAAWAATVPSLRGEAVPSPKAGQHAKASQPTDDSAPVTQR